jgi:hypothetical protein
MQSDKSNDLAEWRSATEGYLSRAKRRHSEGLMKFVVAVHGISAYMYFVASINAFRIDTVPIPLWFPWFLLAIAALLTASATGGFWIREARLWVRVCASVGVVLGGVVTGISLPILLNVAALVVLAIVARRNRAHGGDA